MNKTKILKVSYIQKDIFWATFVIFIALVGVYIFFLGYSILNVSARQTINDQVVSLRSKVAQLEFKYVSAQNSVTSEVAYAKGFVEKTPTSYTNKETRLSLSTLNP